MGYSIYIGNAEASELVCEDGEYLVTIQVNPNAVDGAPCDGSPTDGTNGRWPSYSGWSEFIEDAGLVSLFRDESFGIMRNHPGCFALEPAHLEQIKKATCQLEWNKGRLEWLKFWVEWALTNCERPAIYNS